MFLQPQPQQQLPVAMKTALAPGPLNRAPRGPALQAQSNLQMIGVSTGIEVKSSGEDVHKQDTRGLDHAIRVVAPISEPQNLLPVATVSPMDASISPMPPRVTVVGVKNY